MKKIQLIVAGVLLCMAVTAQNITSAEYFIDNDLGFGNNKVVTFATPGPDTAHIFTVDLAGVTAGYHKLYIRTLSSDGRWGHTTGRTIEVLKGSGYVIKGAEYFFDTDPGFGNATAVNFNPSSADSNFAFKIPLSQIPTGAKTLYVRTKDSVNNNWGLTQWEKDSVVTSSGLDSLWSHPATWSNNKVPDANTVVLLHHKVYVDIATAVCKSLAPYRNDAQCIVMPNMKVTVAGHR